MNKFEQDIIKTIRQVQIDYINDLEISDAEKIKLIQDAERAYERNVRTGLLKDGIPL